MNWRSCMFTQHTTPRVQKPNTCCYRDAVTGRTTCSRDCRECCRCRRCCSVLRMRKCGEKCLARVSLSLSRALCELKGGLTTKWNTSRKIQCGWHIKCGRHFNKILKLLAESWKNACLKRIDYGCQTFINRFNRQPKIDEYMLLFAIRAK